MSDDNSDLQAQSSNDFVLSTAVCLFSGLLCKTL